MAATDQSQPDALPPKPGAEPSALAEGLSQATQAARQMTAAVESLDTETKLRIEAVRQTDRRRTVRWAIGVLVIALAAVWFSHENSVSRAHAACIERSHTRQVILDIVGHTSGSGSFTLPADTPAWFQTILSESSHNNSSFQAFVRKELPTLHC